VRAPGRPPTPGHGVPPKVKPASSRPRRRYLRTAACERPDSPCAVRKTAPSRSPPGISLDISPRSGRNCHELVDVPLGLRLCDSSRHYGPTRGFTQRVQAITPHQPRSAGLLDDLREILRLAAGPAGAGDEGAAPAQGIGRGVGEPCWPSRMDTGLACSTTVGTTI